MEVQVIGPSQDPSILDRQESQRRERIKEALQWLEQSRAVMENGHFRFGSRKHEQHGAVYVNPRRLFNRAYASKWLANALYDVLPTEIRQQTEIVGGPPTGGVIVVRDLSDEISTKRKKNEPEVEGLFFSKDADDVITLHEEDRERVKGRRILLVDDVRHRGATFAACAAAIKQYGGIVIATAELIDRGLPALELGVPNFYVAKVRSPRLFYVADCPMCKAGVPITKF